MAQLFLVSSRGRTAGWILRNAEFCCSFKALTEFYGEWEMTASAAIVELTSDEIARVGGGIWITDIWIISGNEIWPPELTRTVRLRSGTWNTLISIRSWGPTR